MFRYGHRMARPRDAGIDDAVLAAAQHHLAERGYGAMSVAAVAAEAGTTRQAVYRRWPSKADLATAAIAALGEGTVPPPTDDPFEDLVAELRAFRLGVLRPNGISLVGTMLQDGADPELVRLYRRRVVEPRRRRIRAVLERGVAAGELAGGADLDLAAAASTGSLYALVLAGKRPRRDWPVTTSTLVWRGLGGGIR
jgi:AcrR family transcriptional regulator